MRFPVILLVGKAGSGKDTVGALLAKNLNGQTLALADEMKRVLHMDMKVPKKVLWGPSELRNTPMGRCSTIQDPRPDRFGQRSTQDVLSRNAAFERLHGPHKRLNVKQAEAFMEWFNEKALTKNTVRYVLQTLGTEWGRANDPDIWIDIAIKNAETVLAGGSYRAATGVDPSPSPPSYKDFVIITDGRFRNEVLAVRKLGGIVIKIVNPDEKSTSTHASETEQDSIPEHWFDLVFYNDKTAGLDRLHDKVLDLSYFLAGIHRRSQPPTAALDKFHWY